MSPEERWQKALSRGLRVDGCLLWPGATMKSGDKLVYGVINDGTRQVLLHRFAFLMTHGWLPPSGTTPLSVVSHLCDVTLCFEPAHLVVETQRENLLRRQDINHHNARKDHCPKGHSYDYTYPSGKRGCRRCNNDKDRARYLRAGAERGSGLAVRDDRPARSAERA